MIRGGALVLAQANDMVITKTVTIQRVKPAHITTRGLSNGGECWRKVTHELDCDAR